MANLASDERRPPAQPGTYAWYFERTALPALIPLGRAHHIGNWVLLYVGIAPARPSPGRPPSRRTLRTRLRFHFRGNARGSTLRLSLGCVLADELGVSPVCVCRGDRIRFRDEKPLSEWMTRHARVCWVERHHPWELQERALRTLDLPLNLAGNRGHPFRSVLAELRGGIRDLGRLP